jgi:hypothetical protein
MGTWRGTWKPAAPSWRRQNGSAWRPFHAAPCVSILTMRFPDVLMTRESLEACDGFERREELLCARVVPVPVRGYNAAAAALGVHPPREHERELRAE